MSTTEHLLRALPVVHAVPVHRRRGRHRLLQEQAGRAAALPGGGHSGEDPAVGLVAGTAGRAPGRGFVGFEGGLGGSREQSSMFLVGVAGGGRNGRKHAPSPGALMWAEQTHVQVESCS